MLDKTRAWMRQLAAPALDYALPPRCPGCGVIVEAVQSFCPDCWQSLDFLGDAVCAVCGEPAEPFARVDMRCGACLADPPPYATARAATSYGEVARVVAHRLKYGRRMGNAALMARLMARLLPQPTGEALIVPVPLHRWRLWSRGFNQAVLIGRALARASGARLMPDALVRTVNTPPLHQLGRKARARAVKGAFAIAPGKQAVVRGRAIVLVDDIWTTGATAVACARALTAGGARRVDIVCWTRVTADQAGEDHKAD